MEKYLNAKTRECLGRLVEANVYNNNWTGDDPRTKNDLKMQLCVVARKTMFSLAYKAGWEFARDNQNQFFKNITLDEDIVEAEVKSQPKNANNTYKFGFYAGVIAYMLEYVNENEEKILKQTI